MTTPRSPDPNDPFAVFDNPANLRPPNILPSPLPEADGSDDDDNDDDDFGSNDDSGSYDQPSGDDDVEYHD